MEWRRVVIDGLGPYPTVARIECNAIPRSKVVHTQTVDITWAPSLGASGILYHALF